MSTWTLLTAQLAELSPGEDFSSSSSSLDANIQPTPPHQHSSSSSFSSNDNDDDREDEEAEEEQEEEEEGAPPRKVRKRWANALPPCRVCAEPSSGFHYGVNTCEACKMFFKRCQTRKRPLRCKGKRTCHVRGVRRMVCAYCRYQWCLTLGMSRDSIKLGRYTCSKRRQDCQEIRRSTTTLTPLSVTDHHLTQLTEQLMTSHQQILTNWDLPEAEMIEMAKTRHEKVLLEEELFGNYKEISFEDYQQIYRQTGLDIDDRGKLIRTYAHCMERQIRGFVHFAKGVPGFSALALEDQASLIKASHTELWFLGVYRGFIHQYQTYVSPLGFSLHLKEDTTCYGSALPQLEYDMAHKLQRRLQFFSKREIVLLKAICLMSADRCQLKDKDRVEDIHWRLVCALLTSLRKTRARTDHQGRTDQQERTDHQGRTDHHGKTDNQANWDLHAAQRDNPANRDHAAYRDNAGNQGQASNCDHEPNGYRPVNQGRETIPNHADHPANTNHAARRYSSLENEEDKHVQSVPAMQDRISIGRAYITEFGHDGTDDVTGHDVTRKDVTGNGICENPGYVSHPHSGRGLAEAKAETRYVGTEQTIHLPDLADSHNPAVRGTSQTADHDVILSDVTLFSYVVDCLTELRTLTEKEKKAHESTPLVVDIFQNHPMLMEVIFQ